MNQWWITVQQIAEHLRRRSARLTGTSTNLTCGGHVTDGSLARLAVAGSGA